MALSSGDKLGPYEILAKLGEGVQLWQSSAALGHAPAEHEIGVLYHASGLRQVRALVQPGTTGHPSTISPTSSRTAPRDLAKAFQLYSVAAEKNIIAAWYSLGCMYQDGRGVVQDKGKARAWLEKAANYQFSDSVERLLALR